MHSTETILITGASSGIGAALAQLYLERGHTIAICGRDEGRVRQLTDQHERAVPLIFDTLDSAATTNALNSFAAAYGPIDRIILNAGTHAPTDGAAFCIDTYAMTMTTNYMGTLNCLAPAIEILKAQGGGQLALMGSVAGYKGLPGAGGYCASKAAIMRLAETLKVELETCKIDVRLISPGFVKTPLTDKNDFSMPFLMSVDDAALRIEKGLRGSRFEICFPRRLAWMLKAYAALPSALSFTLARKMLRTDRSM